MIDIWDLGPDGPFAVYEPNQIGEVPELVSFLFRVKRRLVEEEEVPQLKANFKVSAHFTDNASEEDSLFLSDYSSEQDEDGGGLALLIPADDFKKVRKRFPAGVITISDSDMTKLEIGYLDTENPRSRIILVCNIQKTIWDSVMETICEYGLISKPCLQRLKMAEG